MGRPRLPLSDMVFSAGTKVYSTMSCRRAMTDVRNAQAIDQLDGTPSFNSILGYLKKPEMTPLLKTLIEQSALPLKGVESDFAADSSSGFSTSVYDRWFDHKWGREKKEARWIKAHIMCGVKTNIVTAVEVTETAAHDSPFFPALVQDTARSFDVQEVSADKAYLSRNNLREVEAVGGTAYIPFKSNSLPYPPRRAKPRSSVGERLPLLPVSPGRVPGLLSQAFQRGDHLLDGQGQVRSIGPRQDAGYPGQRGPGEDPVP